MLLGFFFILAIVPILVLVLSVDVQVLADFGGLKSIVEKGREIFDRSVESVVNSMRGFMPINHGQVKQASTDLLKSLSGIAGRGVSGFLGAGPELATNLFLFLITFYYSLMCLRPLRRGIMDVPLLDLEFKAKLIRSFSENAYSSVVAATATAAVQAGILGIGMICLGYPHWILATALAFVAAFIPVVGTLPVSAIVIIQFAIEGDTTAAIIMLIVAVGAGLSDNFIRPMFLKGAGDMHPWLAFMAVLGGLAVFGIWGLFIGPIAVGMLQTAYREWRAIRLGLPRPPRHPVKE